MPDYYSAMLDLRGRPALVIGGDRIAAEKAAGLSASGARVEVLSPAFGPELLALASQGQVKLRSKTYEPGDLAGAFVVIAATTDPTQVQAIWEETQRNGQLVNIVDNPAHCSFILPSILRREQLTVSVSTEGASPGLAKRIRQELEAHFPQAYGPYLRLAALVRQELRAGGVSYDRRDAFFQDFFTSKVLSALIDGDQALALKTASNLLAAYGLEVSPTSLEQAFEAEGKELADGSRCA